MASAATLREIEALSEALVLADRRDPAALEDLRSRLGAVRRRASGRGRSELRRLAREGEQRIEAAAGTPDSPGATVWDALGLVVDSLLRIAREDAPPRGIAGTALETLAALDAQGASRGAAGGVRSGSSEAAGTSCGSDGGPAAPEDASHDAPGAPGPRDDTTEAEGCGAAPFAGDEELLDEFAAEAAEHLEGVESRVLALERGEEDDDALHALFRTFHTIKGAAGGLGLDAVAGLAHDAEGLLDLLRSGEVAWSPGTGDAVLAAADGLRSLLPGAERTGASTRSPGERPELSELRARLRALGARTGAPAKGPETAGASREDPSREVAEGASASGEERSREPSAGTSERAAGEAPRRSSQTGVRVDAERLDRLVETIGELTTAVNALDQSVREGSWSDREATTQQVTKVARDLQELGTSLRMVSLRSAFARVRRAVRDLARRAGKDVRLEVDGEETEIDKGLVERVVDPLLHLARNAVDHGIETPAERRAAGKPPGGTIRLAAGHRGGRVRIEVADDGRGLDRGRLLEKARALGRVAPEETPSESELDRLIFEPGFSTASGVSEVSGRGVGMDVVLRNVEELRGTVRLESTPGGGTHVTLHLPLTVGIVEGMVARVGPEHYVIPTLAILRSVQPAPGDAVRLLGRGELLRSGGELLPLCRLADAFGIDGAAARPEAGIAVLVEAAGRQAALLVDELVGRQQVVIKGLGRSLGEVEGIAGGAVLADGSVGLIVDPTGIVKLASQDGPGASNVEGAWEPALEGATETR